MLARSFQRSLRQVGRRSASTGGLCFSLSEDQKAFQELARNFAKTEMIPVGSLPCIAYAC